MIAVCVVCTAVRHLWVEAPTRPPRRSLWQAPVPVRYDSLVFTFSFWASSHRRHRQDKTVLSCSSRRQFCSVSSAVWTHLRTSLLDRVSKYDVTVGKHVACELETGSGQDKTQFTLHFETGQNCFEIFSRRQSWLVANSVHTANTDKTRQDRTVLSCRCQWCELAITFKSWLIWITFIALS